MKTEERKELSPSGEQDSERANEDSPKGEKTAEAKRKYMESHPELSGRFEFDNWKHPHTWKDGPLPVGVTKDEVCKHCDPDGFSDLLRPGVYDKRRVESAERSIYKWCDTHEIWECHMCQHWIRLDLFSAHGEGTQKIDWDKANPIMDEALRKIEGMADGEDTSTATKEHGQVGDGPGLPLDICLECGGPAHPCLECGTPVHHGAEFCSMECDETYDPKKGD